MGMVAVLLLLAVPAWHQVHSHHVHTRFLRAVSDPHGPEVPPTQHERNHRSRPLAARIGADLFWVLYLFGVAVLGWALH
jgi:hypothetical protein